MVCSGRHSERLVQSVLRFSAFFRGMSRSTKYYQNLSTFDPERHLKPDPEVDPREFVFRLGRRLCPSNELAFQAIWIMAASILWSFKLQRVDGDSTPLDDDLGWFNFELLNCIFISIYRLLAGKVVTRRLTFGARFVSSPVAFKCRIDPRSDQITESSVILRSR